jgi:hypothetical protein
MLSSLFGAPKHAAQPFCCGRAMGPLKPVVSPSIATISLKCTSRSIGDTAQAGLRNAMDSKAVGLLGDWGRESGQNAGK